MNPHTVSGLERYADRHFNGNTSAAADHLLNKAMQQENRTITEGLVYAGIGTAALLLIGLLPWVM